MGNLDYRGLWSHWAAQESVNLGLEEHQQLSYTSLESETLAWRVLRHPHTCSLHFSGCHPQLLTLISFFHFFSWLHQKGRQRDCWNFLSSTHKASCRSSHPLPFPISWSSHQERIISVKLHWPLFLPFGPTGCPVSDGIRSPHRGQNRTDCSLSFNRRRQSCPRCVSLSHCGFMGNTACTFFGEAWGTGFWKI